MSEANSREDFRDALLAQDSGVNDAVYAAYRLRLDAKIDDACRLRRRRSRLRWLAACVAVAAAITLLVWRPWSSTVSVEPSRAVVLRQSPMDEQRAWAPFELETKADLIATVRTGDAVQQGKEEVLPLRFERILKGTPPEGWLAAQLPESPKFACCVAAEPAPFPRPKDTRLLVYLEHRDDAQWRLLSMRVLNDDFEARDLPDIERCIDLTEAARSKKPEDEYRRLLCPPSGRLDHVASCTFACQPDPRAADVLLDQLGEIHRRLVKEGRSAQGGRDGGDIASLARLAQVLGRTQESRAAVPIVECARLLPAGHRGPCYRHVPDLSREAPAKDRRRVSELLLEEIDDPRADANDASRAADAVGALADAQIVEELMKRESRQPASTVAVRANRALETVFDHADAERRAHLTAAWIDLLGSRSPASAPPPEEEALLRSVIRMLVRQPLTPRQYEVLRGLRSRHSGSWLGRELDPLVK